MPIRLSRAPSPGATSVAVALGVALALVSALLLAPPAGAAGKLYVDGNAATCSNSGPGSATQPFCTIVRAAQVAAAGDTVEVRAGTYSGTVTVSNSGASGSPIVFTAASGAIVTVTSSSSYGFRVASKNHVTIQGFRISGTKSPGVSVSSATGIVIRNNEVSNAGSPTSGSTANGIALSGCTGCVVDGNKVHHNTDHGIYLSGGTTQTTIIRNETYNNARGYTRAAAGISAGTSNSNTYEANVAHDNEDTGIQVRSGAHNYLIVNNRSYRNGDHGFDTLGATGARYINNVAFGNYKDGISIEGSSTGATVANNISVDNGLTTGQYNLWVSENSWSGFTANFDILWNSTSQQPIKFGGTKYSSVDAFRAATGHESRGIGANPRFAAPGSGDFRLLAGSPAIDSANAGASGWRSTDAVGQARVDDPGTANTGAGSPTFSDRGALEFLGGVAPTNSPPVANPDTALVQSGSANNAINVLGNDTDPNGDPLTVTAAGTNPAPTKGSVSLSGGVVRYTPTAGAFGADSFGYTISDGRGGTASSTVAITINRPPVAVDDSATVSQNSSGTVINVRGNDSDPDGDTVSVTAVGTASHGVASLSGGTVTYSPAAGYTGPDAFTYTISDGRGGTASATVSVDVQASSGAQNLVANPGFEQNTDGWRALASGVTVGRTTTDPKGGAYAGVITNTGSTASNCRFGETTDTVAVTSGGTYTVSMWVRGGIVGQALKLRIREYTSGGSVGSSSTQIVLTSSWQQVSLLVTPVQPGASHLVLDAYLTSAVAPTGPCFFVDDISITHSP